MNRQERKAALERLQLKWGVRRGQIWEITGRGAVHYALCADARDFTAVGYIFDRPVVGIFTSPPYLGQRAYEGGERLDQRTWLALATEVMAASLPYADPKAQVIVNLGPIHREGRLIRYWEPFVNYVDGLEPGLGWPLLAQNVWDKMYPVPGDHYGRFGTQHEFLFHFAQHGIGPDKVVPATNAGKPGKSSRKHGQGETYGHGAWTAATDTVAEFKIPGSVVRIPVPGGFREKDLGASVAQLHPARFPIELPAFHMRAYKALLPDGIWADPFAGSFTTLLAGERECVPTAMIESEPGYFAVALERCALEGLALTKMYDLEPQAAPAGSSIRALFT